MPKIDDRLLDPDGEPAIAENFNRTLALVDKGGGAGVPGPAGPKGDKGEKGADGVGIKTITGSIDSENNLTLDFSLTNSTKQTVKVKITPPVVP